MRRIAMTLMVMGLIVGASRDASAQMKAWEDRVYLNIGFGVESGTSEAADSKTFTLYEENGTVSTASEFTSGSLFDAGIGFRIWKNVSVGASYHQETNDADADITGSAPHPIFFNQPRNFTSTETALERKENATHLQIGYMVPISTKIDVLVFGGPSFFRLTQDVISNVTVSEAGAPFTQVNPLATRATRKQSVTGYNVGADVTYMLWSNDSVRVGAGAFLRYAKAQANILLLQTEQPMDVGGMQFGFGGRFRF